MSVHVDTEVCPEMCLREVAGPQKKHGALTAVLPLPEELETHQSPRTVRSDPPPGDARSLALGPAGSQSGCLSSFQEPCGLGFSLLSYESFSTDPFGSHFLLLLLYFGLNRWIFVIQSVPLLTLSPLFIFQWFPSKSPFLSLSFYGLLWHCLIHLCHIKTFMTLNPVSLVCYSLPLKFCVAISPYFVFCCCFK